MSARLTDPELLGFAFLLLSAGNGTVLLDKFPTEHTHLRASVFRGLLPIPREFSPGPRSDARTNQQV
jgi:hypothetical protein